MEVYLYVEGNIHHYRFDIGSSLFKINSHEVTVNSLFDINSHKVTVNSLFDINSRNVTVNSLFDIELIVYSIATEQNIFPSLRALGKRFVYGT